MAAGAAKWVWANSRASNGSLIVLLAIADECGEGEFTEMKIADLARKCRLSDRAARMAVKDLEALGELSVEGGRGAVGHFAVGPASAKSADVHRQNLPTLVGTSAKSADAAHRQNLPTLAEEPQVKASSAKSADVEIPDALDFGSVVTGKRSKTKSTSEKPRPDVDRLCEHLADRVTANGSRRPAVGKRWKDAARLLLDADGRTEEQVHACIDWCQQDNFWHRHILSMEKLREKYDRLRLDAKAELAKNARPSGNGHQPTTDDLEALRKNWAAPLDAMEAGNDPSRNDRPDRVHHGRLPPAED